MKTLIFKCKFGHITIKDFAAPTPTEIICDGCIEFNNRIDSEEILYNYIADDKGNIIRSGQQLIRRREIEKAYRY